MCLLPVLAVGSPQFGGASVYMEWRDVPSFEGLYKISEYGDLKSLPRWRKTGTGGYWSKERIIRERPDKKGYIILQLTYSDGSVSNVKRGRMMAKIWHPNPNNLPFVNHVDGVKWNDHYSNLEWCTPRENELHAYRTGLKKAAYLGKFGKDHNQSIPVLAIRETAILEFESKTACGIYFGVTVQNVYRAIKYNQLCKGHKLYLL